VAAKFVMKRCPDVKITAHTSPIQDFDQSFYEQFHIIIAGLDNIEARRWLNSMVHSMVQFDENDKPLPETQRPLIDGGTEGFKGQSRVIIPYKTGCFECSLGSLPPPTGYPMCTIRETPRIPEHCIQYAYVISWEESFGKKVVDKDSITDMTWIFEKAKERADTFGIEGVTY
jgi:ubiquitin-activating enzyme E1 C